MIFDRRQVLLCFSDILSFWIGFSKENGAEAGLRTCGDTFHACTDVICAPAGWILRQLFFQKKIGKNVSFSKLVVTKLATQSGPDFCGIEWSLQFSRLHSIPQIFGSKMSPILGHKTRSRFGHIACTSDKKRGCDHFKER